MKRPIHKSSRQRSKGAMDSGGANAAKTPKSPISPAKRWWFRIVAIVVLPLLLVIAAELGLRLCGYGYNPALFKTMAIGGKQYLVNNDEFGLRFFPPQLERFTGPIKMDVQKPPDTYRIFIFGESAAMGDPEPAYGAGRYLEALLNGRFPKTHFEVVNLGITAISSHVIVPIARDCAARQGDLWIIYMGNNEMVGPFGAATVFGAKAPPLPLIRLNLAVQKLRLGQLLVSLERRIKNGNGNQPSWGGMEMFVGNQVPWNDPRRKVVYDNFSRNLDDIVKAGIGSGAKVLLNTVAVNLKDCSPFASVISSNLTAAKLQIFNQSLTNGIEAARQGQWSAASEAYHAAAEVDATSAELQYRWGEALEQSAKTASAAEHFRLACDYDALSFRADTAINSIIREESKKIASERLVLVDAARLLDQQTPAGICGQETFYEHVHFNGDGNFRIATEWAEQAMRALPDSIKQQQAVGIWPTREACERRLGLTDWNSSLVLTHMVGRFRQPPLNSQLGNDERMALLQKQLAVLHAKMTPSNAARDRLEFEATIKQVPDDYILRENFALFLQATGDLKAATEEWRRIHELLPQDFIADFQLGQMLAKQSQYDEAKISFRRAVMLHPTMTEGWFELANTETANKEFDAARRDYEHAHAQRPQDPAIVFRTGKLLALMNHHADAIAQYREAIRLNPDNWEYHFELGGELDAAQQLPEAAREFELSVKLNPTYSRVHFNHGVLLGKQGRLDEARAEFEETIRLEPGYKMAQTYLDQLKPVPRRATTP